MKQAFCSSHIVSDPLAHLTRMSMARSERTAPPGSFFSLSYFLVRWLCLSLWQGTLSPGGHAYHLGQRHQELTQIEIYPMAFSLSLCVPACSCFPHATFVFSSWLPALWTSSFRVRWEDNSSLQGGKMDRFLEWIFFQTRTHTPFHILVVLFLWLDLDWCTIKTNSPIILRVLEFCLSSTR